jgi:hypothetical protein
MSTATIQFITQVKLAELRRQRSLLVAEYDRVAEVAAAGTPVEGLRALFDGLSAVQVVGQRLHPDLGNLDLLLNHPAPSAEIVAFWRARLERELAAGRLRADIVYLFGALLGEWGEDDPSKEAFLEERQRTHGDLLRHLLTPGDGSRAAALLGETFDGLGDATRDAAGRIAAAVEKAVRHGRNAESGLGNIAKSIYQPPAVRQEARRFLTDDVLRTQYEDALRVVTRDPRDWSWPTEGVGTRALWTRNKWRLYPNLSLVQLGVLNSVGHFWSEAVEEGYTDGARKLNRLARYQKLLDLNAPEVIIENERRMLRREETCPDLGWYEPLDPWDGTPSVPADGKVAGIVARRADEQRNLRAHGGGGYYDGYGANRIVGLVNAELRTLRAAFPDRPLFIATLDIRDYFASLPHEVPIAMLRGLGLPADGVEAVRRYLAVPLLVDGRVEPARRGVPMDQHLSHWLAEWLLRLMERYVHQRARVRIIRQIDDICLMAPTAEGIVVAWRSVHEFVEACGLSINDEKAGAVALGAELPAELPRDAPRWGLLGLSADGEWAVHEPTFRTFLEETREHVSARHALLARVTLYNAHLKFLASALGLSRDLGNTHRASVADALRRFEGDFFGPGLGIVAGLRDGIARRYLEGTRLGHLPESWMYWPVTAGGLGLRSALVLGGQYRQAMADRKDRRHDAPTTRPADWQYGHVGWTAFYEDQLETLEPARPRESKVMKALVDDFIARGQEISAGRQAGLSDYWRWVLCTYGPEILDRFGTFRFLLTDLVPLQLIHEQLLHDSSLEG